MLRPKSVRKIARNHSARKFINYMNASGTKSRSLFYPEETRESKNYNEVNNKTNQKLTVTDYKDSVPINHPMNDLVPEEVEINDSQRGGNFRTERNSQEDDPLFSGGSENSESESEISSEAKDSVSSNPSNLIDKNLNFGKNTFLHKFSDQCSSSKPSKD